MTSKSYLDESNSRRLVMGSQPIAPLSSSVSRCKLQAHFEQRWNKDNKVLKMQAGIEDEEETWIPLSSKNDKHKSADKVARKMDAAEKSIHDQVTREMEFAEMRIREQYQSLIKRHPRMNEPSYIQTMEKKIQDVRLYGARKIARLSKKSKAPTKSPTEATISVAHKNKNNDKNKVVVQIKSSTEEISVPCKNEIKNENTTREVVKEELPTVSKSNAEEEAKIEKIRNRFEDLWDQSPHKKTPNMVRVMEEQIQSVRKFCAHQRDSISKTVQKVNEDYKITETIVENKVQIGTAAAVVAAVGLGYAVHKHCKANQSKRKSMRAQSACQSSVYKEVGSKFRRTCRRVCVYDSSRRTENWEGMITPFGGKYWLIPSLALKDSTHIRVQSNISKNLNTINEIVGPERYVRINKDLVLIELITSGLVPNFNKFLVDKFKGGKVTSPTKTSVPNVYADTDFSAILGKDGRIAMESVHTMLETFSGAPILTKNCEFVGIMLHSSCGSIFTESELTEACNSLDSKIADFRVQARKVQSNLVAKGKDPLCAQAGDEYVYKATMGWLPNIMRYRNARSQGGKFYTRILQSFGKTIANSTRPISLPAKQNDIYQSKMQAKRETVTPWRTTVLRPERFSEPEDMSYLSMGNRPFLY